MTREAIEQATCDECGVETYDAPGPWHKSTCSKCRHRWWEREGDCVEHIEKRERKHCETAYKQDKAEHEHLHFFNRPSFARGFGHGFNRGRWCEQDQQADKFRDGWEAGRNAAEKVVRGEADQWIAIRNEVANDMPLHSANALYMALDAIQELEPEDGQDG